MLSATLCDDEIYWKERLVSSMACRFFKVVKRETGRVRYREDTYSRERWSDVECREKRE